MRELEEELREALARIEPPGGFAERVLARTHPRVSARPWYARYGAVAAMIAVTCGLAVVGYQRHVDQERARKLVFALNLTAAKLASIQQRLKTAAPVVRIAQPQGEEL